jgi:hypothetical protein
MFPLLVIIAAVLVLLYLLRRREEENGDAVPDWVEKKPDRGVTPSGERADDPTRRAAVRELEERRTRLKAKMSEIDPEQAARALRRMIER